MDRELAEQLLGHDDDDDFATDDGPSPDGYTLDTYLLLTVIDGLQGVQAAVIAAAGADPPPIKPMPRPMTAVDLLREERRLQTMHDLVEAFEAPAEIIDVDEQPAPSRSVATVDA
ncbi:hypothetical protein [Nocardia sp. NPDC058666]|uniref:hypothetical protein n=1 Tax=unclassified Nocardia TaxID=2637762 RepID=UPI0036618ADA